MKEGDSMNFKWVKNDIATPTVTIYDSNLTLNKIACEEFNEVRYVLLGLDEENRQLAIKPITKDEIDLNIYPSSQLHKISIGKSYGRISNKPFIKSLSELYGLNFEKANGIKFNAQFDSKNNFLVVQL